uniref:Uncharacterized protein n=1 Tax=Arundo donax TaxID=35708 RepID=A0A0A9DQZ7_ARUDO
MHTVCHLTIINRDLTIHPFALHRCTKKTTHPKSSRHEDHRARSPRSCREWRLCARLGAGAADGGVGLLRQLEPLCRVPPAAVHHGHGTAIPPVTHVAAEQLPGDAAALLPAAQACGAAPSLPGGVQPGSGRSATARLRANRAGRPEPSSHVRPVPAQLLHHSVRHCHWWRCLLLHELASIDCRNAFSRCSTAFQQIFLFNLKN